jgi:CheY-like chemotaxis protein
MNILIAEDDNPSRFLLKIILEKHGHKVLAAAENGKQLMEFFEKHKSEVDIVFTDVMMPIMNGLEAAREIKRIKKVPIVAVTAMENGTAVFDREKKYIPWGTCDFFVRKPIEPINIVSIIDLITNKKFKS